jgi:hypothetical protein
VFTTPRGVTARGSGQEPCSKDRRRDVAHTQHGGMEGRSGRRRRVPFYPPNARRLAHIVAGTPLGRAHPAPPRPGPLGHRGPAAARREPSRPRTGSLACRSCSTPRTRQRSARCPSIRIATSLFPVTRRAVGPGPGHTAVRQRREGRPMSEPHTLRRVAGASQRPLTASRCTLVSRRVIPAELWLDHGRRRC